MTRSTRRRRSRGGADTPYNALMNFLKDHQEYQSQLSTKTNTNKFPSLLTPDIMTMLSACRNRETGKVSDTSKVPPDYHKQLVTFIDNVCLAMKTDYKNKCIAANIKPDNDKSYNIISDRYRDTFGNSEDKTSKIKNFFSPGSSKKNPNLETAVDAWGTIEFNWKQTPRRELTPNEIHEQQANAYSQHGFYSIPYRKGGSRRRKTRKH